MTTNLRSISPVRAFAARRPVLSYLLLTFGLGWAFLMPPALMHFDNLILFVIPTALIAQLGAAVLVTALAEGRDGVRALLRRTFRWRVNPVWYLVAAFGLPALAVAGAIVVRGSAAVADPSAALAFLTGLAVVPLINLWEETGWMGFVQTRLQLRHGALVGALLTAPLFALLHLPLQIGNPPAQLAVNMGILLVLAAPFRIVVGWIHNRTGGSILLAAVFHASFNVGTSSVLFAGLLPGLLPGLDPGLDALVITAVVLVVWAVAAVVLTRGRLSVRAEARGEPVAALPV